MRCEVIRGLRGGEWRRVRRDILRGGGGMAVEHLPSGAVWRHAEGLEPGIDELLALHAEEVAAGRCFKDDRKRRITAVNTGGRRYIVKEFRRILRGCPFSPDRRSWLCGHRLVGAVGYLGWYRDSVRGVIVMEDAGEHNLCFRDESYDYAEVERWFCRAAAMVACLHRERIYHADVKPHNFVMERLGDCDSRLTLIDCDDVRLPLWFGRRLALKNLGQLIGGLSYSIGDSGHRHRLARAMCRSYAEAAEAELLKPGDRSFWESYCVHLYPDYEEQARDVSQALFEALE